MKRSLIVLALVSAVINLLHLTGSFYMLQVYDRVLPSRSVPSLIALSALAALLFLGQWVLEWLRARAFVRLASRIDEDVAANAFSGLTSTRPSHTKLGERVATDVDQVRAFIGGGGLNAFFDLPWAPLYLAICYACHPLIDLAATAGAGMLLLYTLASDLTLRRPTATASAAGNERAALIAAMERNHEVLRALGMSGRFNERLARLHRACVSASSRSSDLTGFFGTQSRTFRVALQSAVLGLGAWLVIQEQATAGVIIASSIVSSRALAPIEQVIAHWKGLVATRQAMARLSSHASSRDALPASITLPGPTASLLVENISVSHNGRPILRNISFALRAGNAVGVVGPSASGKTSLARTLAGLLPTVGGGIRLDQATLSQWSADVLGRHIGYVPQRVEFFAGTVAENIGRFDPAATSEEIVAAAQRAGVHDMIVRLPQGYATLIGEDGVLSSGQSQRIALARALYKDPFLLVLDEPNSNLDAQGEYGLVKALTEARARGAIVVVIAHRPNVLAAVDHVLVLEDGRATAFGPRDQVLRPTMRPVQKAEAEFANAGAA